MVASQITPLDVDELIEDLVRELASIIADLRAMGLTKHTYDQIEDRLYMSISDRLQARGMSRQATAVFMGKSKRGHQHTLQQIRERLPQPDDTQVLYWKVASYIYEHPKITRRQLLSHFDMPESVLLSLLKTLKDNEVVWEGPGRGDDISYSAPKLDFPCHDPATFLPKMRHFLKGMREVINASVELEVLGREKDVYILTMETECDEESDSGVSSQIRRVINKVPEELRPLWEQLEANPSDRKSTKMTVIVSYTSERIKHEERRGKQ